MINVEGFLNENYVRVKGKTTGKYKTDANANFFLSLLFISNQNHSDSMS
jgi:hypothetical protein